MPMTVSKTRDMLVDVARQLFARMGVDNTTMNDIAQASRKGRRTLVFRNGTLRATFFRDIWRVEKVRKSFDLREVEIIKGILDDGVKEGIFSMPDTDITALVLHHALKGLEVPYIRGIMGDNISQRIKRRDNVMNLIFNGIKIK